MTQIISVSFDKCFAFSHKGDLSGVFTMVMVEQHFEILIDEIINNN